MAKLKVLAVMTAARYEGSWCRTQIENSLRQLGIPLTVSNGVFYGQCMQRMLERAVADGVEYVVTIDGDTVFKPEQLSRLISIAYQEGLDALCAMQMRRGKKDMLGCRFGNNSVEWNGYPIELDSAHFGLTVLDVELLAKTPKPWFFCKPDENGEWSDNRIDSDVWFWQQWRAAGGKIWMDPGTRIGHVEEMIAVYDENWKPTHIYQQQWSEMNVCETDEDVESEGTGNAVGVGTGGL